jgi:signal transduction histidine kinase
MLVPNPLTVSEPRSYSPRTNPKFQMSRRSPSQSSLLRLLMILEWVLLGIVAIAQILSTVISGISIRLLVNGLGLGIFAILGRVRPQTRNAKLIYTFAEFSLIFGLALGSNIPLPNLLFIVLVIRNCVLLTGWPRAIVTGLAFCGSLIVQTHRLIHQILWIRVSLDQIGSVWIGTFIVLGLVILFLHLLVDAALKESYSHKQLTLANTRLRQYALRVEELATEQERNRIARDIHDSVGHSLTVFGIHLEAALRLLHTDPAKAEKLLLQIKQLNSTTLQEVRQSVAALRSDPLQGRSLEVAIADLVTEFQQSTQILTTCTLQLPAVLPQDLNLAIYRIVQESLTNICKYAAATTVSIAISPSHLTQLQVIIADNGRGFDLSQNTTGFGLQGMQERALALAGQLEIISAPGQGCQIKAMFPIAPN